MRDINTSHVRPRKASSVSHLGKDSLLFLYLGFAFSAHSFLLTLTASSVLSNVFMLPFHKIINDNFSSLLLHIF